MESRNGTSLLFANSLLAALLVVAPWTGTLIGDPARTARAGGPMRELLTFTWVFPAQVVAVAALLLTLTWVEYAGIRFIAARRNWRLTRVGAWQVCCHASVGWVVLGVMPLLALALLYTVGTYFGVPLGRSVQLPGAPGLRLGELLSVTLPVGALMAGLFVYELLVHMGVRKCRYAAAFAPARSRRRVPAGVSPP